MRHRSSVTEAQAADPRSPVGVVQPIRTAMDRTHALTFARFAVLRFRETDRRGSVLSVPVGQADPLQRPKSWRDARMKAGTTVGRTCLYSVRKTAAWATSGSRCQARIWHATCDLPTVRHALHPRCLCDRRTGTVRRLHPQSQEWVDAGMAWRRVDESPLRQSDPVVPESV